MNTDRVRAVDEEQKQAWDRCEVSPPLAIAPDVIAIPVPIQGGPMVTTLCYALLSPSGEVHLIDPGWDSDPGFEVITAALAGVGRTMADVRTLIATHFHPDHLGMAPRIREESGARIIISRREFEVFVQEADRGDRDRESHEAQLRQWGVPPSRIEEALEFYRMPFLPKGFEPDQVVEDGEILDLGGHELQMILTPGHTSGHLCLLDESRNLLYAGDHLLPRIYAGVGLGMLPGTDPLAEFMDSLDAVLASPQATVLPGHEYVYDGVGARVEDIRAHHLTRTREVAALMPQLGDAPVWEYAKQLTWSAGWERTQGFFLDSALRQTALHVEFNRSGRAAPHLEKFSRPHHE